MIGGPELGAGSLVKRGTGGHGAVSGLIGVKWRCLKEQRKKFAITMTVNIHPVHLRFINE